MYVNILKTIFHVSAITEMQYVCEHENTLMKVVVRFMISVFMITAIVCIVLIWHCLHYLNIIHHYLSLPTTTIYSETSDYEYDDEFEE